MKFTIDWLKDHLKTKKTEAQIIEKLNSTGLEVEKVEPLKNEFSDFIIAKIVKTEKHPNVLKNAKVNSKLYQGYAFGVGIDRLAMLKYGINDLRAFF